MAPHIPPFMAPGARRAERRHPLQQAQNRPANTTAPAREQCPRETERGGVPRSRSLSRDLRARLATDLRSARAPGDTHIGCTSVQGPGVGDERALKERERAAFR